MVDGGTGCNFTHSNRRAASANEPPALIAAVIVLLFGVFADQQNKQLANERQRAEVFIKSI
jgi:sensor domain CHASE-containing protein